MSGLKIEIRAIHAAGEIKQVAWIEINNVEAGNSFGPEEAIQLLDFLDSKEAKKISGIVWTNEPGFPFCRGGNLKYYRNLKTKLQGIKANKQIQAALSKLEKLPFPCIAVICGDVFGGGLELLTCFDFVYSTPQTLLGYWQRKIGLSFGWGGGARSLKRLSVHKLIGLALEARSITAYEAQSIGLIEEVIPVDLIQLKASKKMQSLLSGSPETFQAIKSWSPKQEQAIFERLWWTPEHRSKTSRPIRE
jgi:enoyl-CoA hydratase/carnithine racemase